MTYSRLLIQGARALLACMAMLPFLANAQTVDMMNVRFVRSESRVGAETSPGRWVWNNAPYTEVKRTDTAIMLRPNTAGGIPVMLDISRKQVFMDFDGVNFNGRIDEIGTATGVGVGRIELLLSQANPQTGALVPQIQGTFDANGGTDEGWSVHLVNFATASVQNGKILASAAQRNARSVTLNYGTRSFVIDVVSRTCQSAGYTCQVRRIVPVSGKDVGHIKFGSLSMDGSRWGWMYGITQTSTTKWRVEYEKGDGMDLAELARTSEYVELLQPNGVKVRYDMEGGRVQVQYPGGGWEPYMGVTVAYVQRQWPGQLGTVFAPVSPGVSPGFQIQNKTDYPVLVTLEQIGCLYYGIVQPGQVFQRNTGAVWFTIKASMAPDLKEPTVASCIRTPAIYAAKIAISGAMVAGTAGMALVVPAMLATAAGNGSAIAVQQAELASGATTTQAALSRVSVSTLARGVTVVGLVLHAGSSLPGALGSALTDSWMSAATGGAYVGGVALTERYSQQSDIDGLDAQLTQEARVFGAYAGYPWPWKMVDRVMPRYDITGGPRIRTLQDGTTVVLTQERPLTITKVN